MELSTILGWTATILFTICYIPQIMKTLRTQTTAGLSILLLIVGFVANCVALWYSVLIGQAPLQMKYILGIIFVGMTIIVYISVHRKNHMKVGNKATLDI
jgi:uncharacterized protein with PQ loop repeat